MKSLAKNITKIFVFSLFIGLFTACAEDNSLEDIVSNIKEVPVLETGDDPDEPQQIPGG